MKKSLITILTMYDTALERMHEIQRAMNSDDRELWPTFAREAYRQALDDQAAAEIELENVIRDMAEKCMKVNPCLWFIAEQAVRDICDFLDIPLDKVDIINTSTMICNSVPGIDVVSNDEYDQLCNGVSDGEVPF